MKNFNTCSINLVDRVKSACEAKNFSLKLNPQNWLSRHSFTHSFNRKLQRLSNKNFAVIASVAITLSFIPLLYEVTANNSVVNEQCFPLQLQFEGLEGKRVHISYGHGLIIQTIYSNDWSFETEPTFKGSESVKIYLLEPNGVLMWEGNVSAAPNSKVFFTNNVEGINVVKS
jgi:hypothetical protein